MLKRIIIVLAIIVIMPLIAALFMEDSYSVERELKINKPKSEVFDYIKMLKNQDNFSKWAQMDPNMKKTYTGTDGTIGFISAWSSENENVGVGEQEIMKIKEGERIDFELRFIKPFESTSPAYMITESAPPNSTIVKWGFHGKMEYPMNLMLPFVNFDEMIGNDFETGLNNLKEILEK